MFAIFENGGKQYKVSEGDKVVLEKIDVTEGEKVVFKQVLLVADEKETQVGTPFVDFVVEAKVLIHGRGEKIRVVKHKAKKRYNKVQGHRQDFTEVEILKIMGSKSSKKVETTEVKEKSVPVKKTEAKVAVKKKIVKTEK